MKNKNKVIILVSIIALVLIATLSLTYAAMAFNQTGGNSDLVLGDIYMHYNETKALTIEDAMPGSPYTNYFEFTISGKNTYTKNDIFYDFLLTRGDLPSGKTEDNRIPDNYLKFKLVSVVDNVETVLFQDETYLDLNNKRIYVETIAKNTTEEINRTYRLYATIDYNLEIGTSNTAVFTLDEWENAFASVKVNVTGDFTEKEVLSYNDCFETTTKSDGTIEITNYYTYYDYMDEYTKEEYMDNELYQNPICTTDVVIPSSINGRSVTSIGDSAFSYKNLSSVVFPNTIVTIGNSAFSANWLKELNLPNSVTAIGDLAFESNELTNVTLPNSVTTLGGGAFVVNPLEGDFTINIGNGIKYIAEGQIGEVFLGNVTVNIDKTCAEIRQITKSSTDEASNYPWFIDGRSHVRIYRLNGTDGLCYSGYGDVGGIE